MGEPLLHSFLLLLPASATSQVYTFRLQTFLLIVQRKYFSLHQSICNLLVNLLTQAHHSLLKYYGSQVLIYTDCIIYYEVTYARVA